jgi:hypothetical protein
MLVAVVASTAVAVVASTVVAVWAVAFMVAAGEVSTEGVAADSVVAQVPRLQLVTQPRVSRRLHKCAPEVGSFPGPGTVIRGRVVISQGEASGLGILPQGVLR